MAITTGTAWTPNAWATCGFASTSMRASRNFPAYSVDSWASTAPRAFEPCDRGEYSSTTTGAWRERSITSDWKLASPTSSTYAPVAPPPAAPPAGAPGAPGAPAGLRRDDRSTAPGREKLDWLTTVLAFRAHSVG